MHRYLISSHSSIPYLDPSRPMPDSLTPPNGATSVEITPVLIPRIPYSSASETRQIAGHVAAVEVARQAVGRVVGLADRLLLGGEAADPGHGAERLLVAIAIVVGDAGEHRRREELPAALVRPPAEQQLGAALERVGDVALDLLERRRVDQRADVDALGEAVGDDERRERAR